MMEETTKQIVGYKVIPDDQKMTLRLRPEPGRLLRASLLGATIRNMGKLVKACSDQPNSGEETFVIGLSMDDQGVVDIEFAVLPRLDANETLAAL